MNPDRETRLVERLEQVTQELEKVAEELRLFYVRRSEKLQYEAGRNGRAQGSDR